VDLTAALVQIAGLVVGAPACGSSVQGLSGVTSCDGFVATQKVIDVGGDVACVIEGCVRETYGAIVALVRTVRAKDSGVREAMRTIARDECRHAELSWRIAAWAMPQLRRAGREKVERSMREAVGELARSEEASGNDCRSFLGLPSSSERQLLIAELAELLPQRA
jgi:hypothetical protein